MVTKTRKGCRDLVWQIQHQHCKPSSGILRALWRNELCVRQPDWNLAEPRVDRLFTNSCVSIDAQDVHRANRSRFTRQDEPTAEAHAYPENAAAQSRSIWQPTYNRGSVIGTKPFCENAACGFAGLMDQKRGRSIRARENFHHFNLKRGGPFLKY